MSAREAMERAMRAAGVDPEEVRTMNEILDADPGPEPGGQMVPDVMLDEPSPYGPTWREVAEAAQARANVVEEQIPLDTALCSTCSGTGLVEDPETGGMRSCRACGGLRKGPDLRETGERSIVAARQEAEAGMARASRAERVQEWKLAADAWFEDLPWGHAFTADDLTLAVGLPDASEPGKNNVLGAWFSGKVRQKRISWTGAMKASERVARHANQDRVWRKT